MVSKTIISNAKDLENELLWFKAVLQTRSALNAKEEVHYKDVKEIKPPSLSRKKSEFAKFIKKNKLDFEERFLLILGLVPYIRPELLDVFIQKNQTTQQIYTEFGGKIGQDHNGFLPTGETYMFLLTGGDLSRRFELLKLFEGDHVFAVNQILTLEEVSNGEPFLNGRIKVSKEILDLVTTGEVSKPTFSREFPARLITTNLAWENLILSTPIKSQIEEIETWLLYKDKLLNTWKMKNFLQPGYKTLFYGSPGTGKSMTASLLGKKTGLDVYRIDLSQMVSKYIGETEKNLAKVFNRAEHKNWILFFDEADALFGKRTATKDAHDRFANQEVSYLLQRIEEYDGLIILASNMKSNIDDAFLRRFQSIIHFSLPSTAERLMIWQQGFSSKCKLENAIDLNEIASKYEISGGMIMNVIQYCSLMALKRKSNIIFQKDIVAGIRKEYLKSGRTL
jgi:AAA+ superfamily predicted ATPase